MAVLEDLEKTMQALEKRIQALEDLESIKKLKARYAQLADERYGKGKEDLEVLAKELGKLFTEDAIWDGGEFGICKGREEIYQHFVEPRHSFAIHYFTMTSMTIEGNKAHGSWIFWMPATTLDNIAVCMAGQEDEEYAKTNGEWLITHLRLRLSFHTPYDQGWVKRKMIS